MTGQRRTRPGGRLITLEGPDGSGKTLQAAHLATALAERGFDVVLAREPGGTPVGERIRDLLLARDGRLSPATEVLLFNASRAEHVAEVLRPALAAGRVVVCARFADSTLAYQGQGSGQPLETLRAVIAYATGGLAPDRTILLDLPVEAGLARKRGGDVTRFEARYDTAYHERVRAGFLAMAAAEPRRWTVVDADRDPDLVFADVLEAAIDVIDEPDAPRLRMER